MNSRVNNVLLSLMSVQLLIMVLGNWFFDISRQQLVIGWVVWALLVLLLLCAVAYQAYDSTQTLSYHILDELTNGPMTIYQLNNTLQSQGKLEETDPPSAFKTLEMVLELMVAQKYIRRGGVSDIYFTLTQQGASKNRTLKGKYSS